MCVCVWVGVCVCTQRREEKRNRGHLLTKVPLYSVRVQSLHYLDTADRFAIMDES